MAQVLALILAVLLVQTAHAVPASGGSPAEITAQVSATAQCANPHDAADSLFIHLDPKHYAPERAARCLEVPEGQRGTVLARKLKQVLDARRLYVPVSSLPTQAGYQNEDGQSVVVPMPEDAPWLVLHRGDDGQWRYSRSTLAQVPKLHRETFSPVSRFLQTELPDPLYTVQVGGVALWQLLYGMVLLGVAWLLGLLLQKLLRGQVVRIVRKAGLQLDPATWSRTSRPLAIMAMALVLLWGVPDLALSIKLSTTMFQVCWIIVSLAGVAWVARLVDVFANVAATWAGTTESRLDDQLVPLIRQAVHLIVYVVGTFMVLDAVGVDVWKLVAGVSIGGLAFALAAQDTVANLFGSLNIFVDKPFQIGDWVRIGSVEGTVEEVGFRSTRVRTFYNSLVTIPNSAITNANVDNMGKRHRRRVKLTLGLTYSTPPDKVQAYVEGIRAILAAHPTVERTYEVHFYNLGGSALEILVYYHLVVPGWTQELESRSQNLMEFMRLAKELGVSFAYPSTSVYLESTPERPKRSHASPGIDDLQRIVDGFGPEGEHARPEGPRFHHSWSVEGRTDRGSADDGE